MGDRYTGWGGGWFDCCIEVIFTIWLNFIQKPNFLVFAGKNGSSGGSQCLLAAEAFRGLDVTDEGRTEEHARG